ncbi:uncharacterized protein C2845_PM06G22070 [Panicum miliaceum]|uniref:At4g15545-like C-terminal domain-containing protein n=1 Tax=Panicum miliaceum TaxID=4540 RepID=A0A3L6RCE1_PANMI|nr:uncharacterized protein C2845_PM06G22070 [Panicum miliaceum]
MAEEGEEAVPPAAVVGEAEAEAGEQQDFGLSAELVAVLPSDPFAQLDVARKITSIALSSRLGRLEAEAARLRAQLAERDAEAEDLRERVEQLDAALAVATGRLGRVEEEKETLVRENSSLSNTVRKLNRDVAKLEVFKKTLVQSLQEDDGIDTTAPMARVAASPNFSSAPSDEDSALQTSKSSQFSETASSVSEGSSQVDPDGPQAILVTIALHLMRQVKQVNFDKPKRRTRVDGKEFFRQVRNRLSYEQFGAFLANVKELNAYRQTREDTLRKADEIFGPENKDLYTIFESLITRNVQ